MICLPWDAFGSGKGEGLLAVVFAQYERRMLSRSSLNAPSVAMRAPKRDHHLLDSFIWVPSQTGNLSVLSQDQSSFPQRTKLCDDLRHISQAIICHPSPRGVDDETSYINTRRILWEEWATLVNDDQWESPLRCLCGVQWKRTIPKRLFSCSHNWWRKAELRNEECSSVSAVIISVDLFVVETAFIDRSGGKRLPSSE